VLLQLVSVVDLLVMLLFGHFGLLVLFHGGSMILISHLLVFRDWVLRAPELAKALRREREKKGERQAKESDNGRGKKARNTYQRNVHLMKVHGIHPVVLRKHQHHRGGHTLGNLCWKSPLQ